MLLEVRGQEALQAEELLVKAGRLLEVVGIDAHMVEARRSQSVRAYRKPLGRLPAFPGDDRCELVDPRAVGRADARRVDQILHEQ